MPVNKLSIQDFAAKIKAKYPDYKDINDTLLTQRIVEKYPEYKDMVNYQLPSSQPPAEQPKLEQPEHEISHNSIHDIRHLNEMANQEIAPQQDVTDPLTGAQVSVDNSQQIADKKAYGGQFETASKELGDRIGTTPDKVKSVLQDFPDDIDEESIKRKSQLLGDNPESYNRLKSADENVKLLAKKGGVHVANEYNHLQGTEDEPIQNLQHLKSNIDQQREMILSNLSGPERDKALANLERNRSSAFNATNPEIVDEYNANEEINGQLNAMQYAGLKSLEAFDPNKAKLYSSLISKRDNESDDTVEQKIGLEKVRKELLDIGRKNTERYINESQYDLDKAYKNAQTDEEKQDVQQQFLHNKALIESMNEDTQKDATRFPYIKDLEFERQAKELSGEADMGVIGYALNKFGRGIGSAGKSVLNAETNLLGTDQDVANLNLERIGEKEQEKNEFYLPEADKPEGSPVVYQFDKPLQDAANALKKDKSLSDEDRNKKLVELVKGNQDQVHTITNTGKYGKSANLFSKATLYKNAGMIGDIASIAAQQVGTAGVGLPKLLASALPMYLSTQNEFYKDALDQGKPNPMAYANTHAAIMMAAGMINPDLSIVKRSLGSKTELGKALAGVSENTWKAIVSENKPIIDKFKNSLGGVAKEAAKMGLTYGAGTSIASDLANKGFFNSNKSGEDILNDAVKETKNITTSSLALLGLHGITNFKTVSPEEKGRVWELGDNPKLANERIDDAVKSGEITTQIADQRKQIIKQVSKLIDSVPTEDSKGKPLTDQQRSDYLYNLVIKNKIDGIKTDLPDAQKEKLEGIKRGIDIDNNAILDPKTEKENLMQRKRELTDELTPGEDGSTNLTPLEKKTRQEELDGINEKLEEINNPKAEKASAISVIRPEQISRPETITIKPQDNAIQEQSAGEMGVREPQAVGEGVGQGNAEPESPTGESLQSEGQSQEDLKNGPPSGHELDWPFQEDPQTGISHRLQQERAFDLKIMQPERGEGVTLREAVQKGRDLIKEGTDPEKVYEDFKESGKISADAMSVIRARHEELVRATNKAHDQFGENSPQYKAARDAEEKWRSKAVKPMQTEWHKIGMTQQGVTDLDTESVNGFRRAFQDKNGKDMTEPQVEKAKELVGKVKELSAQVEELKGKLDKAMSEGEPEPPSTKGKLSEKTKKAADAFRKLKTKPFTFKDSNGNDVPIQKMGVGWNDLVELGAKAIEKTGQIADGVLAIVEKIKDADWYKSLSKEDKDRFEKELTDHYTSVADKKTAARIKALEKELADLEAGNVRTKGAKREPTDREKELKEQILDAKERMGLGKGRAMPKTPKTPITGLDMATHFVGKTDKNFTPDEAKAVWTYLKDKYINNGVPLGDALKSTATDIGLSAEQILAAISTPKGAKDITLELFKKQYEQRKVMNFAKRFVDTGDQSAAKKFFSSLPSFFFNLKTYGHGTVGNITHAGPNIFRPSVWKAYWPNVLKSFSLAYGKEANYEKAISLLKSSKNFDEWIQAGLAADPNKAYDEYQVFGRKGKNTKIGRGLQWLGEAGNRGFSGLNFMRYDMAEMFYNRASDSEKADPELRSHIAELVNHATGHTEVKVPKLLKPVFFAPGLEISRWQRMITDPVAAINTFAHWNKKSPAEQAAAKIVARGAGEKLAVYGSLLAANAGLLYALGSKQQVNTTDPTKSDWLRFKMAGRTLDVSGNILSPLRLLSGLVKQAHLSMTGTKKDMRTKPGDKDAQTLGQQVRYKLSPLSGEIADVATGTDAMGNPEPWSNVPPGKGRHKMNWFEYVSQQGPIPVAAGIKAAMESMEERGMSKPDINSLLNGLLLFGVEGFTGAKLNEDYEAKDGEKGGHESSGHPQRNHK